MSSFDYEQHIDEMMELKERRWLQRNSATVGRRYPSGWIPFTTGRNEVLKLVMTTAFMRIQLSLPGEWSIENCLGFSLDKLAGPAIMRAWPVTLLSFVWTH
mgnify:CR=1 FL=1